MIDDIPTGTALVVLLAIVVAGFMRGFIGFGANLINVPVLSLVVGPLAAVAIGTMMSLPATFQLLPTAIRESERRIVLPMCAAIVLTCPVGVMVLVNVDADVMKIVISMTVIALVALLARGWRLQREVGVGLLLGAGAVGGIVQGASGLGGPPVVAVALSRPGTAAQQRANVLAVMTAVSFASLMPYAYFGLLSQDVLIVSLVLFPVYSVATWFGARYFSADGQKHYRVAALLTLGVVGVVTLGLAVRDYYSG